MRVAGRVYTRCKLKMSIRVHSEPYSKASFYAVSVVNKAINELKMLNLSCQLITCWTREFGGLDIFSCFESIDLSFSRSQSAVAGALVL